MGCAISFLREQMPTNVRRADFFKRDSHHAPRGAGRPMAAVF
jgi:hypothetical protein